MFNNTDSRNHRVRLIIYSLDSRPYVPYRQSSEQVTISCGTRVSKIPKYLDT